MRKLLMTCTAAAALFTAGAIASPRAQAMTITAPAGLGAAAHQSGLAEQVAYICRPVSRCGYWGCAWQRVCWWRPGPSWGYGYGHYRPWSGWGWRRHYW